LLFSFVCFAEGETITEPATETAAETTTVISTSTTEPDESSSDPPPSFESASTWIVFILALIVGIFLGQALSFWKW
jgi:hypothetical protein